VLDAVNEVSQSHRNDPRMSREHRKVRLQSNIALLEILCHCLISYWTLVNEFL
jgi:hypothetical protein